MSQLTPQKEHATIQQLDILGCRLRHFLSTCGILTQQPKYRGVTEIFLMFKVSVETF